MRARRPQPVILNPEQYPSVPTYDLLHAAALGQAGVDHRLLRAIVDRGEDVLPDLQRFFQDEREDDRYDLDDVILSIVRHLHTPAALPFLSEYARQFKFNFPDDLSDTFLELGAPALEPLLALCEESGGEADAVFALAALRVHDSRVLQLLTGQLEAAPFDAALNLGLYGDPAAVPAIQEALAKAEDESVRRELENALEEIAAEEPPEQLPSYDIFAEYPEREGPRFAALDEAELLEFLASPVAEYRAEAASALALDEMRPPVVARIFEMAKSDPDVHVRADCWEALEGSLETSGVRDALTARLKDEAAPVEERCAALVALASEGEDQPDLRETILKFYAIPEARAQAIKAMWRSMDRRFAEYIPKHLDDPDLGVRRQAVWAVGWLGIVSQIGRIERLFENGDLREPALYAYALAAPSEVSPAHLRRLLRRIEELAGGFSHEEGMIVRKALDDRLQLHGLDPMFLVPEEEDEEEDAPPPPPPASKTVGRNDPCPCGSGKKHKKCCGQ